VGTSEKPISDADTTPPGRTTFILITKSGMELKKNLRCLSVKIDRKIKNRRNNLQSAVFIF
jgi:hypothetical protein